MNYYCISYLQKNKDDETYYHLPVTTEVTTDIEVAKQWFQNAVNILKNHYGRKLLKVEDCKLDHMCVIKQAKFECTEPAYAEGLYFIELNCYTHNPCNTL